MRAAEHFVSKCGYLTMKFIGISIVSALIVVLLAGYAPKKFCAAFERGYTVGYQRELGRSQRAASPACPNKSSGARVSGYLIVLVQGIEDADRAWASVGR